MATEAQCRAIGIGVHFKRTVPHRFNRCGQVVRDARSEERREASTAHWQANGGRVLHTQPVWKTVEAAILDYYRRNSLAHLRLRIK